MVKARKDERYNYDNSDDAEDTAKIEPTRRVDRW